MTPFDAGHLLGGALWRLATRDDEAIVYAAAYNHRKARYTARRLPAVAACTVPLFSLCPCPASQHAQLLTIPAVYQAAK